jgi:hypothetical protein
MAQLHGVRSFGCIMIACINVFFRHGDMSSDTIKGGELFGQLNDYKLFKK